MSFKDAHPGKKKQQQQQEKNKYNYIHLSYMNGQDNADRRDYTSRSRVTKFIKIQTVAATTKLSET